MIPPTTLWRAFRVWRAWRRGERGVPLSVTYFVNGQCNLRCRGCFFFEHPAEPTPALDELDTLAAKALIDDLAALGVPFLELVGGEPFLRRDLFELARHARARGLWCGVTTNGTRFPDAALDEVRRVFRTVFVSIDGFEDAHDTVRGVGTYRKTLHGLRRLLDARGPALLGVSTIVGPENVDTLPAFGAELRALGVQQWVLSSGLAPAPRVDAGAAEAALAAIRRMRREHPAFIPQDERFFDALLGFYRGEGRYGCDVEQLLHVSVTPGGETSACCTWPVPLGPARRGSLGGTLASAPAAAFAPVARCGGCVRHDYAYTMRLFRRPLPALVAEALSLAAGPGFGSPRRLGAADGG